MLFSKKNKDLHTEEYEKIYAKYVELRGEFEDLKVKYRILDTNLQDLRGKFNRKISLIKKDLEAEQEETTTKPFNSFSPFLK